MPFRHKSVVMAVDPGTGKGNSRKVLGKRNGPIVGQIVLLPIIVSVKSGRRALCFTVFCKAKLIKSIQFLLGCKLLTLIDVIFFITRTTFISVYHKENWSQG